MANETEFKADYSEIQKHTALMYEMKAVDDANGDAPDGAWWMMLQDTAGFFYARIGESPPNDDYNDCVCAYLDWLNS